MQNDAHTLHVWNLRYTALHNALANRLYHQECAHVFETRDRMSKLVGLVGASAVFMTLAQAHTAQMWALVAFVGSAASLVFRWAEKARHASERMNQYAAIHADILRVGEYDFTEAQVNEWKAKLSAIVEPAPNAVLWNRVCHQSTLGLGGKAVQQPTRIERLWPAWLLAIA